MSRTQLALDMTATKSPNRRDSRRASTPRSRGGCSTCRQRHLKCDQARPSCQQCVKGRWPCPGYDTSPDTARQQLAAITLYNLPCKVPGSQEERKALHYYTLFAAPDMDGYMPADFWSHMVLQRCHSDVPIRRAAAALGRIHMEYRCVSDATTCNVTATTEQQYGKAIKALRRYLNQDVAVDRSVVLVCCAIFFAFELIRGQRQSALKHLHSGLGILKNWQDQTGDVASDREKAPPQLVEVFSGLDLQATIFDDEREPTVKIESQHNLPYPTAGLETAAFASISEVKRTLFPLIHTTFGFLMRHARFKSTDLSLVPFEVICERRSLIDRFDHFQTRLDKLEKAVLLSWYHPQPAIDRTQRRSLAVDKLHYLVVHLLVLHSLQDSIAQSAPTFDDKADEMLDLARQATDREKESGNSFSLQLGIVAPVFTLALKTTKSSVRQAAIEVLQDSKGRREGFHEAYAMAEVIRGLEMKRFAPDASVSLNDTSRGPALEWIAEEILRPLDTDQDEESQGMEKLLAMGDPVPDRERVFH